MQFKHAVYLLINNHKKTRITINYIISVDNRLTINYIISVDNILFNRRNLLETKRCFWTLGPVV